MRSVRLGIGGRRTWVHQPQPSARRAAVAATATKRKRCALWDIDSPRPRPRRLAYWFGDGGGEALGNPTRRSRVLGSTSVRGDHMRRLSALLATLGLWLAVSA